ncbi:MAG: HAMP domain-containing histidine kinase [Archangium sp.]|nr:HAMP domain-containing histidine kinase [Archangium sp.]
MAGPENVDLLSFRRTFTLLILLVVLPSAGLSGFGIVAIINERAAVEKRIESLWIGRVNAASVDLTTALKDARIVGRDPVLVLESGGVLLTDTGFRVTDGLVETTDPKIETAVRALGAELVGVPATPVVFSVTSPQGTFLLAAVREGDHISGAQVSAQAIEKLLSTIGARVTPQGEEARYALVAIKREAPPEGVMARFVSGVSEVREAALGPRELAGVLLPSPLQDFRLVVQATGEDPVATASTRNRVVYSVLLGLFYVTLALGVIYTGRTLYREARLSRLKTDFVSLVSHELRTPITSIRMFIETLALGRVKDPAELQTIFDLLSKETARLSGMIESVLDWSRIESGKKTYRKEKLAAQALADAAVEAFKAQHIGKELPLKVTVAPELGEVEIDRDAVSGALLNLLQNAWKYSNDDKRIELRVLRDDEFVVFEVEDHGVGIPKREQKRIFDRFYRVDSLLTRVTEGSGLGLSIAQRIVQAHDGWISVDSVAGRGSTFRIHLPRSE